MRLILMLAFAMMGAVAARAEDLPEPPRWNVRVEVLMVALPQDKLLTMLPDLRDSKKIEAAVGELLVAVQRKEATLTGYPILQTRDGEKAVSETLDEKRYPVGADLEIKNAKPANGSQSVEAGLGEPSAFDSRNLGVTLEAEARVNQGGESIYVSLVAQRVAFQGWENIAHPTVVGPAYAKGAQPQFLDSKVQCGVNVPNGGHLLLSVHVLPKPEGQVEVFVLHAAATAMK